MFDIIAGNQVILRKVVLTWWKKINMKRKWNKRNQNGLLEEKMERESEERHLSLRNHKKKAKKIVTHIIQAHHQIQKEKFSFAYLLKWKTILWKILLTHR